MIANLASFLILCLFLWGRSLRFKNNRLHAKIMCASFGADLILIAALVCLRDALNKINPGMPILLMIHLPFAVSTVVLYVVTIRTGYLLYRGKSEVRPRLKKLDKALLFTRVMTLVTSLMMYVSHL